MGYGATSYTDGTETIRVRSNHSLMQREKFAYPMQKCSLRFVETLTQSFFARFPPHGLQLDPAPSQCFG